MLAYSYKLWSELLTQISRSMGDADTYMTVYGTDRKQAEKHISMYSEMKDLASLGDIDAKKGIIDNYVNLMSSGKFGDMDSRISRIINFKVLMDNDDRLLFELLLENRALSIIIDKYNIENVLDSKLLRKIFEEEDKNGSISKTYCDINERMYFASSLIYAAEYGQDCIDSLQHQDINEIGVIGKEYIYIVYKGRKIHLSFLFFENSGIIINIQKKTTQNSALNYDRQNPIVVSAKNNSSRISVAGYDVTPAENDLYYNERIFNLKRISLEDLVDRYKTIDKQTCTLLTLNQRGKGSFLITGSDMGVGKSTFLLAMIEKYPDFWGIGVLDPQNEMQVGKKYPAKNVITLVENSKKNMSECFDYLLKTSRDIMLVSEITMPEEVTEMVNAALRLNAGVGATLHSYSPNEVVPNLRNLMLRTEMYHDRETAEADIAGSIDLIIHLRRLSNGRVVVDSINEIVADDIAYFDISKNVLNSEYNDLVQSILKLGIKALFEKVSGRKYNIKEIVKYNEAADNWDLLNSPSDKYIEKISRYISKESKSWIINAFNNKLRQSSSL